jgi:hypothetical protein
MKKFLFLTFIFSALISASAMAQTSTQAAGTTAANDQAAILKQMKEKQAPLMVEKTGLSLEKANKIIELNFEMRQAASGLQGLSDADRATKLAELKEAKAKKFAEFLTPEEIASVKSFYEEMGKNMAPKKD